MYFLLLIAPDHFHCGSCVIATERDEGWILVMGKAVRSWDLSEKRREACVGGWSNTMYDPMALRGQLGLVSDGSEASFDDVVLRIAAIIGGRDRTMRISFYTLEI